ncbi:hypothetical protein FO519_003841 [Halicephalobus sp. NKZ332]|nr:hypothetical protein FO519_003841 [Halicephalobus sp. NKZ332]
MPDFPFEAYHTYELRIVSTLLFIVGLLIYIPIFFLVTYLALKRSFILGDYKSYIFYAACVNFFYLLLLVLWIPIPLFPCFAAFSVGWLSVFRSVGGYVMFTLLVWSLIQIGAGIYIVFIYRVLSVVPKNPIKFNPRLIHFAVELILLFAIGLTVYYAFVDENQTIYYFEIYAPSIFYNPRRGDFRGLFVFEPSFVAFVVLYGFCFLLFGAIVFAIVLTRVSLRYLNRSQVGSQQTFVVRTNLRERRLNKMLLKLIMYQTWIVVLFLFLPLLAMVVLLLIQIPYSAQVAQILISLSSFYPFVDGVIVIYNIKPYRRFVITLFKKIFKSSGESHRPRSPGGISVLSGNF